MATINFLYRSTKEEAPLTIRILHRHKNKDYVFSCKTEYEIKKSYWKLHGTKSRNAELTNKQADVNTDLEKIKKFIIKEFKNSKFDSISNNWLKEKITLQKNPIKEEQQSELITDAIQFVVETAPARDNGKKGIGLSTCRVNAYLRLKELFTDFQGEKKYLVKELNQVIFDKFKGWLLNPKNNYSHSYALKKLTDLKTVCKDARKNGIETSSQLEDIKIKQVKTYQEGMDVIILTPDEIDKIEKTTLLKDAHINARKWLILACFIGQRGGDLIKITKSNFKKTDHKECIELTQQKTGKKVEIPILPKVRNIFENGLPYKVSTQKLNKYFKEIGRIAGIDTPTLGRKQENGRGTEKIRPKYEYISTHTGRRSFASNHYRKLPTPIIMQVTSHAKESTFLEYVQKKDDSHIDAFLDLYKKEAQKETKLKILKNASNQN